MSLLLVLIVEIHKLTFRLNNVDYHNSILSVIMVMCVEGKVEGGL
jgi:hypothetical protein